jgi:hypothetical protein
MIGTSAFYGKGDTSVAHASANDRGLRMRHRGDALAYKTLFFLTFAIFLPAAAVRRVLPGSQVRSGGRRSIFEEAKVAASTASACAFMG